MKYNRGDIVIIRFPFSDLSGEKKRPALIISNKKVNQTSDYLMVQITSKIRHDNLTLQISQNDYLHNKELPLPSCIRLHKIFLLNGNLILSRFTAVNPRFLFSVVEKLIGLIT